MAINLSKSSFLIYIEDRDKVLANIFWETASGLGKRSEPIRTSNGRQRYFIPTRAEVKNISLSKAANPDEDGILWNWLQNFCADTPLFEGQINSGAILFLVPLKPCLVTEPYALKGKAYNLIPVDSNLWDADISNVTDVSRVTLECVCTEVSID